MKAPDWRAVFAVTGFAVAILGTLQFLRLQIDKAELHKSWIAIVGSVGCAFLLGIYSSRIAKWTRVFSRERRIFLSYAHQSSESAKKIAELLRESGVRVWLDVDHIRPGEYIRPKIDGALEHTDTVVFLLQGAASPWLLYEIDAAQARHLRIIPVVVGPAEIPSSLKELRYIDMRNLERGHQELVKAVQ